jgi:hypothetical protein
MPRPEREFAARLAGRAVVVVWCAAAENIRHWLHAGALEEQAEALALSWVGGRARPRWVLASGSDPALSAQPCRRLCSQPVLMSSRSPGLTSALLLPRLAPTASFERKSRGRVGLVAALNRLRCCFRRARQLHPPSGEAALREWYHVRPGMEHSSSPCGIMKLAMPNGTDQTSFTVLASRLYKNDVGIRPYQVQGCT